MDISKAALINAWLGSLDLDKMHVDSNKILIVWNAALWHTKNSLNGIIFFLNDVEIEKQRIILPKVQSLYAM